MSMTDILQYCPSLFVWGAQKLNNIYPEDPPTTTKKGRLGVLQLNKEMSQD
jgi:hypothetical protein